MPTTLQIANICVYALLVVGFVNRKRIKLHIPIMVTAFILDMSLLLYIELTRHAIEKATTDSNTMLRIHVLFSGVTVLLYVYQVISGVQRSRGRSRPGHGKGGAAFMLARLGNLITSFLIP